MPTLAREQTPAKHRWPFQSKPVAESLDTLWRYGLLEFSQGVTSAPNVSAIPFYVRLYDGRSTCKRRELHQWAQEAEATASAGLLAETVASISKLLKAWGNGSLSEQTIENHQRVMREAASQLEDVLRRKHDA